MSFLYRIKYFKPWRTIFIRSISFKKYPRPTNNSKQINNRFPTNQLQTNIIFVDKFFKESEIWIIYRKTSSFVFGILPDNDNIKDYISGTSLQSISEPSHTPSSNGKMQIQNSVRDLFCLVSECMSGYLENQLNFAVDFKNGKNYKKSLLKYVHHLVQFSNENRLREVNHLLVLKNLRRDSDLR